MSITSIWVSKLETARSRILARNAETIFCHDESTDDLVMLFDSGKPGLILSIELFDGEAEFESLNLAKACKFVESAKGRCDFKMTHAGIDFDDESAKWPEPPAEEGPGSKLFDDNDDDNAGWWKRGDA